MKKKERPFADPDLEGARGRLSSEVRIRVCVRVRLCVCVCCVAFVCTSELTNSHRAFRKTIYWKFQKYHLTEEEPNPHPHRQSHSQPRPAGLAVSTTAGNGLSFSVMNKIVASIISPDGRKTPIFSNLFTMANITVFPCVSSEA